MPLQKRPEMWTIREFKMIDLASPTIPFHCTADLTGPADSFGLNHSPPLQDNLKLALPQPGVDNKGPRNRLCANKPVVKQLGHDIDVSGPDTSQQSLQNRPLGRAAGITSLLMVRSDQRPSRMRLTADIGLC